MSSVKRFIALIISIVLLVSLIGCNKTVSNVSNLTPITVYSDSRHNKAIMIELIDNFNKTIGAQKGLELVYEVREGDLAQTVELAIATAKAPDIFSTSLMEKYASAGQLAALEDLPGGIDLVNQYKDMLAVGDHIYNGKTYRLPYAVTLFGLIYNKKMFVDAGLVDEKGEAKPPVTFDELRKYAKILTNEEKHQYGIIIPMKWNGWAGVDIIESLVPSCGYWGYNPKAGRYDYSALVPVLKTYLGIKDDKSYYPGAEGIDNDPARSRFAEGNIGMKVGALWDVGVFTEQFPANFEWGVAPFPVLNENERYMNRRAIGFGPCISAQGANSKDPEKIMEVYRFLYGDERATALYKNALDMPVNSDIVSKTKVEVQRKGWDDFSKLLMNSEVAPKCPKYDSTNMQTIQDLIVNYVWTKKMTPEEVVKKYEDDINERVKKYEESHPGYNAASFKDVNWEGYKSK